MTLPRVVIVGRPNVGKSSLFNAVAKERLAIVAKMPGVTRDRVSAEIQDFDRTFELIDTGGIGMVDRDDLENDVEGQIEIAIACADLILFVVDVSAGPTPEDREIAGRLRRSRAAVRVVVNKVDTARMEAAAYEFESLGLGSPIPASAAHRRGLEEILDAVLGTLPPAPAPPPPELRIAIVGCRNAGKSTLVNALAGEKRVIVSETPGTTRDAIDVRIAWGDRSIVVIDTAGVRHRKQIAGSLDFYSQHRTRAAIERCDVALFLIDATREIARLDKQLAGLLVEAWKPCVVVINKWDLVTAAGRRKTATPDDYQKYVTAHLTGLAFAPIVCMSALNGIHVRSAIDVAFSLREQAQVRVGTGELNRMIAETITQLPSRRRSRGLPRIYFVTQVQALPPTFVFFVNDPTSFPPAYRRYVENKLRERFPFPEIPLRLVFRRRTSRDAE
ncbi:MAG TPA: ribosome biogenesis GTPase Der [Planctomycetes bacterium]|nr:ribosome biogenesis GTPase Der [Planctomycetota bacterium]